MIGEYMTDTELFKNAINPQAIKPNEPMSRHTTFKTGGPAEVMLLPSTAEEVRRLVDICRSNDIDYRIIGNGSNLLVGDKGIKGAVIKLGKDFSAVELSGTWIKAQAGALLSSVANAAYRASLTGLEFASGIPGTLGGGVCMNAGAYGGELKDVVVSVTVLHNGELVTLSAQECEFAYRHSRIMDEGMIVLEAELELKQGSSEEIKATMEDYAQRRRSKQPLDKPSAGSTFKRPEGYFAGKLIEDAGLKGFSVGGACVSEKHCGFVVNNGNATSKDILTLIEEVENRVYTAFGVKLEPEVRIIGEF
jgi:UDP-N-acetylmuramate dehydrogenase